MKKFYTLLCGLIFIGAVQAQIIHVPGDQPSIQQGINAAADGDTVLVDDSLYYEQINFWGKSITVASQYLMDGDTSHIGNTIIDGSQITSTDSGSIVYFIHGEDTTSILCGFTIRNGTKGTSELVDPGTGGIHQVGGGVYISKSGAKIIHNHITENHLSDTLIGNVRITGGGGIGVSWAQEDHWIVLDHNIIDHNSIYCDSLETFGGGAELSYNTIITNNVISNNVARGAGTTYAAAGGLFSGIDVSWDFQVTAFIRNNIISDNQTFSTMGYASTAGATIQGCKSIISGNEVSNNSNFGMSDGPAGMIIICPREGTLASGNTFQGNITTTGLGGGLRVAAYYSYPNQDTAAVLVENNYFIGNEAKNGGGFSAYANPVILQNNVFSGNHALNYGGAIYLDGIGGWLSDFHGGTLINNSFSGNSANNYGGAIWSRTSWPLIINSIFWNDSAYLPDSYEIYLTAGNTAEIAFTNIDTNMIHGNWTDGGGNLNADPLFLDPVLLTIDATSPCFNTGTAAYTCQYGETHISPTYDMYMMPRPQYAQYDIGAYEGLYSGISQEPMDQLALKIWPNPVSHTLTFSYLLEEPGQVIIGVYDIYGRLVGWPVNTCQQSGEQKVSWNIENLPAGMYFFRIEAGGMVRTGKAIKN